MEKEPRIRVLVVDDDDLLRHGVARLLDRAGFGVLEACSGLEALGLARSKRPDLLLLDVILPDTNGLEVLKALREDPETKGIYVLMVSAVRTASEAQADGLEAGADGYIARPVSNREMVARVEAMERIILAERDRDRMILELQAAFDKIKTLRGLIPICSNCHKIRNDEGYWERVDVYVRDHTEADFTHSICPDCLRTLYPEYVDDMTV